MVSVKLSTVQAAIPVARPRPSEALGSGSRRMSSQKRMSVVGATPLRLANGSVISAVPAVERQSLSARKAPVLSTSPRPSSIISSYKEPGPSVVRSPPSARNIATPPPTSKIEELDEEEELPTPASAYEYSESEAYKTPREERGGPDFDAVNDEEFDESFSRKRAPRTLSLGQLTLGKPSRTPSEIQSPEMSVDS